MRGVSRLLAASCLACIGLGGWGQVKFNEFLVNPPGTDNGKEFFELRSSAPSYDMSSLTVLVVEGDGTVAGTIDQALSLSGKSTGPNNLFMWRDAATVLNPPPHPDTVIHVADFVPDIENGAQTYIIVSGFTGAVGQDLDTNNDGILDLMPWKSVLDAVGYKDNNLGLIYAAQLGGVEFSFAGWAPDAYTVLGGTPFVMDTTIGTDPNGPFYAHITNNSGLLTPGFFLTPGSSNYSVAVPTGFTVTYGSQVGGTLSSLYFMDGNRLDVMEAPVASLSDPAVGVEMTSVAAGGNPTSLKLSVATRTSALPANVVSVRIQLYNYDTSTWELMDERAATASDNLVTIVPTGDPARFISDTTQEMKVSVSFYDGGALFMPAWVGSVDVVMIETTYPK